MMQGTLTVKPITAQISKDREWFGRQDPYCKITVGSQVQQTRTATDGGKSPNWQDSLSFSVHGGEQSVHIAIFDRDIITRDDFIGDTTIPLMQVFQMKQIAQWYPLTRKGRNCGQINVVLEFTSPNMGYGP